jgi:hypothetical protein
MSAEYGRAGGGVFNVVTKSGTNLFTGSAFEFFRDDRLDGKNYFDDEKPDFRRNQFGGSFGGPVLKNRTFFFGSYEGLREHKGITQVATVLDNDARRGILPGQAPITIPATILPYLSLYPVANGRSFARQRADRQGGGIHRRHEPEVESGLRHGSPRPDIQRQQLDLRPLSVRRTRFRTSR